MDRGGCKGLCSTKRLTDVQSPGMPALPTPTSGPWQMGPQHFPALAQGPPKHPGKGHLLPAGPAALEARERYFQGVYSTANSWHE